MDCLVPEAILAEQPDKCQVDYFSLIWEAVKIFKDLQYDLFVNGYRDATLKLDQVLEEEKENILGE